ncbi:MAG: 50S ribosomal protein L29 [Candidatus Marinimicrobia bacterium]|nr:50S ribosomal protein L29 [Candidatus Neomarinimicrobiota bacterium]|tara:strand:+ start:519 stop:728 length:210 start_codon:yes stop_codon:yes gene_type:complete
MKKQDLKKLSTEELKTKLKENNESLMNMRFQKALQQLEHPKQISKIRKEIAQIKTVLREFDLGIRGKEL